MIISTARIQRQLAMSANPLQNRPPMKHFQFDNDLRYYCYYLLRLLAGMMTLSIYRLVEGFWVFVNSISIRVVDDRASSVDRCNLRGFWRPVHEYGRMMSLGSAWRMKNWVKSLDKTYVFVRSKVLDIYFISKQISCCAFITYSTQFLQLNGVINQSMDLICSGLQFAYWRIHLSADSNECQLRRTNAWAVCVTCQNFHSLLEIGEDDCRVVKLLQTQFNSRESEDVIEETNESKSTNWRWSDLHAQFIVNDIGHSLQVTCCTATLRRSTKGKNDQFTFQAKSSHWMSNKMYPKIPTSKPNF